MHYNGVTDAVMLGYTMFTDYRIKDWQTEFGTSSHRYAHGFCRPKIATGKLNHVHISENDRSSARP